MQEYLIQARALSYRFGKKEVISHLHLHVPKGSIYGFLGPNGAGKTTTIRLLLGLLQPHSGETYLFGKILQQNRVEVLQNIGTLIETPSLYKHLTGEENLRVMCRLLGVSNGRIAPVLEIVRLTKDANRLVRHYSLGMCQRLGIALALLSDPTLLVLDEPSNGLDPSGIKEMRELLIRLNQEHGKTIFLSSHHLTEIEKTVTHLSILHQGHLRFEGTVQEVQKASQHLKTVEIEAENTAWAKDLLLRKGHAVESLPTGKIRVTVQDKQEIAPLNQFLVESGVAVLGLEFAQQSLEELFLSLTDPSSVLSNKSEPLSLTLS